MIVPNVRLTSLSPDHFPLGHFTDEELKRMCFVPIETATTEYYNDWILFCTWYYDILIKKRAEQVNRVVSIQLIIMMGLLGTGGFWAILRDLFCIAVTWNRLLTQAISVTMRWMTFHYTLGRRLTTISYLNPRTWPWYVMYRNAK
jgi:hypothetical protein